MLVLTGRSEMRKRVIVAIAVLIPLGILLMVAGACFSMNGR